MERLQPDDTLVALEATLNGLKRWQLVQRARAKLQWLAAANRPECYALAGDLLPPITLQPRSAEAGTTTAVIIPLPRLPLAESEPVA